MIKMKYEVKILKTLEYLPNVFMIKHLNGMVSKISTIQKNVVDCTQYISSSGMTFNGCFKYRRDGLKETRGIYYTPIAPRFTVNSRRKVSRNIENMKGLILNTLENYGLTNSELFISYDNNGFTVYDRFYKGELYQFDLTFSHGNLEIYRVPQLKPIIAQNLNLEDIINLKYHDYEIQLSSNTESFRLFSRSDTVYYVYPKGNPTVATIKTPKHEEYTVKLETPNCVDSYLIIFW